MIENGGMGMFGVFAIIPILLYLFMIGFGIYFIVKTLVEKFIFPGRDDFF